MIFEVETNSRFKMLCQSAWNDNAQLWISTRNLPVVLKEFILDFLFSKSNPSIVDIGCGNGWLLQEILKEKYANKFSYIGIDINNIFVEYLKGVYLENVGSFFVADFEEKISVVQDNTIDKAIAVLSLIEMSDLKLVFENISHILKPGGTCLIIVLNPYLEMVRLNSEMEELKKDIANFRRGNLSYYEKKIRTNQIESKVNYYGLLHPIEKYFSSAINSGLLLNKFNEVDPIHELGEESTIYQCIEFIKPQLNG